MVLCLPQGSSHQYGVASIDLALNNGLAAQLQDYFGNTAAPCKVTLPPGGESVLQEASCCTLVFPALHSAPDATYTILPGAKILINHLRYSPCMTHPAFASACTAMSKCGLFSMICIAQTQGNIVIVIKSEQP